MLRAETQFRGTVQKQLTVWNKNVLCPLETRLYKFKSTRLYDTETLIQNTAKKKTGNASEILFTICLFFFTKVTIRLCSRILYRAIRFKRP
jgi:hypothetical protein